MRVIKGIATVLFVITLCVGLVLIATEVPENASIWDIVKVNGSGAVIFCVSLMLLVYINNGKEDAYDGI